MPLVADVVAVLNSTVDSVNYTAAWSRLTAKIESVKDSKSLLGYYICDDCDNAKAFPADKMAHLCKCQVKVRKSFVLGGFLALGGPCFHHPHRPVARLARSRPPVDCRRSTVQTLRSKK